VDGQDTMVDLPLDIRATAFQERVWKELRRIPRGETRSYSEVASAIGEGAGARAVARACALNPVAVVVPCHRVVRKDGKESGYRWGVRRKELLLQSERRTVAHDPEGVTPGGTGDRSRMLADARTPGHVRTPRPDGSVRRRACL